MSISLQPIEEQIPFITESLSNLTANKAKTTAIASGTAPLDPSLPELEHQHLIPIVPSHSRERQPPLHLPTLHGKLDYPPSLLDDTELDDTMDSAARFQNVRRFVAGLTMYENIPPDSLAPVVLEWFEDKELVAEISLNSLHWLFEARCINLYNDLVKNATTLRYFIMNSTMAPFDCFVLGYALSHITFTGHWDVYMMRCNVDDECVEMLAGGVNFMSSERLKDVRISKLHIHHGNCTERGAITLMEILKETTTLQDLDVSSNSLGVGGATAIAEMLTENKTLQQLSVRQYSIGDGGATALAEMLKENRALQHLDVRRNSIGNEGATALAEMLKENRTLQQLDVSRNSIGDGGAIALAEMLKKNSTLQQLDVNWNSIGDGGAIALAEMLKENRTLQQLNVNNNSIGEEGATALAEMMKENRTL